MPNAEFYEALAELSAIGGLLDYCEICCVRECCGPNAFETSPNHIASWAGSATPAEVDRGRNDLTRMLAMLEDGPERFWFLDMDRDRAQVARFLSEVRAGLPPVGDVPVGRL